MDGGVPTVISVGVLPSDGTMKRRRAARFVVSSFLFLQSFCLRDPPGCHIRSERSQGPPHGERLEDNDILILHRLYTPQFFLTTVRPNTRRLRTNNDGFFKGGGFSKEGVQLIRFPRKRRWSSFGPNVKKPISCAPPQGGGVRPPAPLLSWHLGLRI